MEEAAEDEEEEEESPLGTEYFQHNSGPVNQREIELALLDFTKCPS